MNEKNPNLQNITVRVLTQQIKEKHNLVLALYILRQYKLYSIRTKNCVRL